MKNFYMVQGLESDVSVTWDVDEETFIISVASNRLPKSLTPELTQSTQKMAKYFEDIRLGMRPIGKGHDGAVEKRASLEQTVLFLHELEEAGYILPPFWEKNLKEKVATQKENKEKSWALQKHSLQQQTQKPKTSKNKTVKNKKGS